MSMTDPFESRYPDADVWEMIRSMKPGVPYGARELADEIGASRRATHRYLTVFNDEGIVAKKDLTPRVAWYVPIDRVEAVRQADPAGEGPDKSDGETADATA